MIPSPYRSVVTNKSDKTGNLRFFRILQVSQFTSLLEEIHLLLFASCKYSNHYHIIIERSD
jgi:hypothetical protein